MAENSNIEWTNHTFNPWRGCTKVSPGCANCYAEKMSHRNPGTLGVWGDDGTRVIAAESYWRQPIKWNKAAEKAGERHRVFCASLADVFEDRPELVEPRIRLFHLIDNTPNLDWLLLTKRPENIARMTPGIGDCPDGCTPLVRPNVWIGVSVEDQQRADERIPYLLSTPAAVRFLSVEPLLGAVKINPLFINPIQGTSQHGQRFIDWVIVGGESGHGARPMHPDWARSLRDQCQAAGVPFFFKQWGEWIPGAGNGFTQWPEIDTKRPLLFPAHPGRPGHDHHQIMLHVGKKAAGRLLDGREWNEMPEVTR